MHRRRLASQPKRLPSFGPVSAERLEGMLAKYDKDGDGKMNRVEIREIMQTMLGTDDVGLERVGRLLS